MKKTIRSDGKEIVTKIVFVLLKKGRAGIGTLILPHLLEGGQDQRIRKGTFAGIGS